MSIDWAGVDRWLTGEAWVNSRIPEHLVELCDRIGPRWASTPEERLAAEYISSQMEANGLSNARLEPFQIDTWSHEPAVARIEGARGELSVLPYLFCPPIAVTAPLVDVGFGTQRELDAVREKIPGAIAIVDPAFEPFTAPVPFPIRLKAIAEAGAKAVVAIDRKTGGRTEYHPATDWRAGKVEPHPVATVSVSRETGAFLRRQSALDARLSLEVRSRAYRAGTANTSAELTGKLWPEAHIIIGGHHDTVWASPGGNDNASGTVVVIETARALARLAAEKGVAPGCTVRFVTFSAEEQFLQGSTAYVKEHYGPEPLPLLMINLDELSTGFMKGVVLQFPQLRELIEQQLASMGDGLATHTMPQLDAWSDHYPFSLRGIQSAILWRWRFYGKYPESDFHHEPGDMADKVRVRDLKEYVGLLARLVLRLSHVPPQEWPANRLDPDAIRALIPNEIGSPHRTM